MKLNRNSTIIIILNIVVFIAILIVGPILADLIANLIFKNHDLWYLATVAILQIIIVLSLGNLYIRIVMHEDSWEMGVDFEFPELIWIIIAFVLPIFVLGFFLFLTKGEFSENSDPSSTAYYLVYIAVN